MIRKLLQAYLVSLPDLCEPTKLSLEFFFRRMFKKVVSIYFMNRPQAGVSLI